ncbi:NnrS family protein [Aliiglaciecola sp. CAU 1673]|uniref:NnrS family protein n=1 Tax=Aliiglaciecola sp. CAU 1673 TaxID=3032595 RepID=UPI0023DAC819|nr:NnrS family protein [Aliiglaciecola sp. CAU 1673]MDF2176638.1 NnrS family protein [Aliiglaciecola sp. CAU 1673]
MPQPMHSLDLVAENRIPPILRQAFRPLFLSGAVFSALAVLVWGMYLSGYVLPQPFGGMRFWHAFEMLFGFAGAAVVGFLLTAVQNWTGLRAIHGKALALLVGFWLVARMMMFCGHTPAFWFLAFANSGFFLLAAIAMARLLIAAQNYRNLFLVALLLLMAVASLFSLLSVQLGDNQWFITGTRSALMIIATMMVIIGGRVIPMFTANGTGTLRKPAIPWLEGLALSLSWGLAIITLCGGLSRLPSWLLSALFGLAALANTLRLGRWLTAKAFNVPLVWSLHLAYAFIPLGFALFSLHFAGVAVTFSTALHALTAGAMGSLILAMISRVSLGHSGRAIVAHPLMSLAFMAVALAALTRILLGLIPSWQGHWTFMLSTVLWAGAYLLFVILYFPALTSARIDGRPG